MKQLAALVIFYTALYAAMHLWAGATVYDAQVSFGTDCPLPAEWVSAKPCTVSHVQLRFHPDIAADDALSLEKDGATVIFPHQPNMGFRTFGSRHDFGGSALAIVVALLGTLWAIALAFESELAALLRRRPLARA